MPASSSIVSRLRLTTIRAALPRTTASNSRWRMAAVVRSSFPSGVRKCTLAARRLITENEAMEHSRKKRIKVQSRAPSPTAESPCGWILALVGEGRPPAPPRSSAYCRPVRGTATPSSSLGTTCRATRPHAGRAGYRRCAAGRSASARSISSSALSSGASSANPTLIPDGSSFARERCLNGIEALAGKFDRRSGHHAHELVAAVADDQVVGTKVAANRADRSLQQRVAGTVTLQVVDRLQTDDVDIGDGEQGRRSARPLDLPFEVRQACGAHSCSRELVGFGDRELLKQRVAVELRLEPVASRLLAVVGRLLAIGRGPRAALEGGGTVEQGVLAGLDGTVEKTGHRAPLVRSRRVALGQFAVAHRGGLIAGGSGEIAGIGDRVPSGGRVDASLGDLLALLGIAIAKVTRQLVLAAIPAAGQIAIAGRLVAVGRGLVAVGGGLVAVGRRLVDIGEGLVAFRERLIAVECPRGEERASPTLRRLPRSWS